MDDGVAAWLAESALFSELEPAQRAALVPGVVVRTLQAGEILVCQGDVGNELFAVAEGLLEIRRRHGELSQRVGVVGPGAIVGENSLLRPRPRNADLVALRDSVVLTLAGSRFHEITESMPQVSWRLLELLLDRGWKAPSLQPPSTVVAIVGLDVEAGAGVARRLADAAGRSRRAASLHEGAEWTPGWLTDRSREAEIVLLSVAVGETGSAFAVRNADRVVLVTSSAHRPDVTEAERAVVEALRGRVAPTLVVEAPAEARLLPWARRRPERPVERLAAEPEAADRLLAELLAPTRSLDWLRRSALFGGLPESELAALAARFQWETVPAGETLFEQGDPADALYVVVSGRLEVLAGGKRLLLLGPGETVGEMGLFRDGGRTASVRALRATVLARLSRSDYEAVAALDPGVARRVVELVISRLSPARTHRGVPAAQVIALLPLDPGPGGAAMGRALADALGRLGPTRYVDRQVVERELGRGMADVRRGAPGEVSLVHLLHRAEDDAAFLVLGAEPDAGDWTRRCLAQADAVVLFADADAPPGLRPFERELWGASLAGGDPATSLLLRQPSWAEAASGTARWLDERELTRWTHVRADRVDDLERAARLISRLCVGVAFSGGGSRGAAHLGVIRALQEEGVPIDAVSGTSAGAAIAGLVARDVELPAATRHVEDMLGGSAGHFAGLGPPLVSVLSGRHVQRLLHPWFGGLEIEDLLKPLVVVATDISTGEMAPITRGPIWRAVRASTSIPGLWPPVVQDGRLHVDGGVTNNVPVDVLAAWTANGAAIASDVAGLGPSSRRYVPTPWAALSGWRALVESVIPRLRQPRPSLGAVVTRTMLLAGSREQAASLARHADLVIRPAMSGLGMFDIRTPEGVAEAAERGYASSLDAMDGWAWQERVGWTVRSTPTG